MDKLNFRLTLSNSFIFPDGLFIGLDCFESDLFELESSEDEVGGAKLFFEKNSSTTPTGKTGSIFKEEDIVFLDCFMGFLKGFGGILKIIFGFENVGGLPRTDFGVGTFPR